MAFASLVYQGQRDINECPHLDPQVAARFANQISHEEPADYLGIEALSTLHQRFSTLDLASRATKLGGWMQHQRLCFHCLGKVFQIDPKGNLHADCHQNPWIHVPLLSYILDSRGHTPNQDWVRFVELPPAFRSWNNFFQYTCEDQLQNLLQADAHLFSDILSLFSQRSSQPQNTQAVVGFSDQHNFVLYPLPRVPFLIACQAAQEDFAAGVSVYLDRSVQYNLDPESVFRLGRGMAEMFRKIAIRHGLE